MAAVPIAGTPQGGPLTRLLWYRRVAHYPTTARRHWYLTGGGIGRPVGPRTWSPTGWA